MQSGTGYPWTYGTTAGGPPTNVNFLFDGAWGHTQTRGPNGSLNMDNPLPATSFQGKYYEFNYSRVYLSNDGTEGVYNGPHNLPGVVQAEDYDTGGDDVGYYQTVNGGQVGYRTDNNGNIHTGAGTGGNNYAVGWTNAGDWYKYTVNVGSTGSYSAAFQVASGGAGGTFHLEDETGRNLTGSLTAPNTGGWGTWQTVTSPPFTLAGERTRCVWWRTPTPVAGSVTSTGSVSPPMNPLTTGRTTSPVRSRPRTTTLAAKALPTMPPRPPTAASPAIGRTTTGTSTPARGRAVTTTRWAGVTPATGTVTQSMSGRPATTRRLSGGLGGRRGHVPPGGRDRAQPDGSLTAPNTGGWGSWQTVTSPAFTLSSGAHTLRLVEDSNGPSAWVCDFDWIALTSPERGVQRPAQPAGDDPGGGL